MWLLLSCAIVPSSSQSPAVSYAALYFAVTIPLDVVTDSLGFLYVCDSGHQQVVKLGPDTGPVLVTYNMVSNYRNPIGEAFGVCLDSV